ncbi:hypothetical protein HRM2_p00350 (plasmid) [Desulforapulum autotrophicum HRM2]|uniref:Uncharacterized protein n=1 Tax=Desulforapulum autotrophicum (strain ATCC 43914 / DSM 3382 / VKM B-1955 / HRM2) TaxID=177437 RepID=C0QMN5_DESAH|nr:hypothetical protein HRM2_p00350 [Desulforapulum autotrophicum HRM2]
MPAKKYYRIIQKKNKHTCSMWAKCVITPLFLGNCLKTEHDLKKCKVPVKIVGFSKITNYNFKFD